MTSARPAPAHIVVAAALLRDDKVLLGHRSPARRWYPDVWDVPGGHVDAGESPEAALVRELHEELGIHVGAELGTQLTRFVYPDSPGGGLDITIWAVTAWDGEIVNRAPDEHDALQWFTRAEVRTLDLAHARLPALLDHVVGGATR